MKVCCAWDRGYLSKLVAGNVERRQCLVSNEHLCSGRRGGGEREEEGGREVILVCVCVCVCVSVNPLTSERAGAEGSPMLLLPKLRVVRVVFLRRAFRIG